ncbi:Bax inhibitor-1/YccA family protein [Massilia sp. TS11]|uniref:Bax inhibitor-1/YccA family protein n=1 Tax=Massilia sp. TS11 TaxID=2908003 RepID=UPI001EDACC65|nr:Bax inhibitor-1/YccA family protein [Massilia sp. TS11]MCG2583130.1 Bax inhibitor-1/YccA family protein [Massilia sp. TS11]
MIPSIQRPYNLSASMQGVRHRVLRNTYWLLALSMLPTVLGAVVGMQFAAPLFLSGVGLLLALVGMFGFIFAIRATQESGWGVLVLLGFTFFMGVMLTPILSYTLAFRNGPELIMLAFGGTAAIFATLASVASVTKRDFSFLGKWLLAGLVVLILASLANIFLQLPALTLAVSSAAVMLFSALILFDVQRIINGGETNYIAATLAIYLDVYNVFVNLLSLLGIGFGERD